jgi:hypothetical protein
MTYNWHGSAVEYLENHIRSSDQLYVISPKWEHCPGDSDARKQWEEYYLKEISGTEDCAAMFWFSRPTRAGRSEEYAKRSVEELSYYAELRILHGAKISVGTENGFPHDDLVSSVCHDAEIEICQSLEETCKKAVAEIYSA